MGTHPIFESDFDCLTEFRMQRIVRKAGNYFRVLGLPQSYKIDQTTLRERVRKLQQEAHPDKGGSLEQSAEINEAARNLKCNHKRGLHLLELNNIEIAENETAASADSFVFEVMEINEEIEEADSVEELRSI